MPSIKNWTKNLPALALIICGFWFCNGQGQLTPDNTGALNDLTEFNDETQFPELDPDWIKQEDAIFLGSLLNPDLTLDNVPLQYVKRRKNQVFSAGLFGKRNGWNQGHQNGLFGKRSDNWLGEYVSGSDEEAAANNTPDYGQTAGQYAKRQRWNPNQQNGLFGKRNSELVKRTYDEMLQTLREKVKSVIDKRSTAINLGRVRTKSSGQHVFRAGGLFGKRSVEEPDMQRALWPENEQ